MSPMSVTTVVVGYDGSAASDRAARRAFDVVDGGGRVVLVTASPTLSAGLTRESLLDSPSRSERDEILSRGQELIRQLGMEARLVASDGEPAAAIAETAAAEAADLIIVGATGTGYVARAILGSTPAAILRLAPCDVLVVR
jgi:maltose/moltooligosaccharide transporter